METPMSDKVLALGDSWGIVAEFLDYLLNERRLVLCTYEDRIATPTPASTSPDALRAEFFEIDLNKLESERRAMLAEARELFSEGE